MLLTLTGTVWPHITEDVNDSVEVIEYRVFFESSSTNKSPQTEQAAVCCETSAGRNLI